MKFSGISPLLLCLLPTVMACGTVQKYVLIQSQPPGARVVDSEGRDTGQTTPMHLPLDVSQENHLFRVEKPGWRGVPVAFTRETTTEVIGVSEVAGSILCAPCCCGLTLFNLLDPVDVNTHFVPNRVNLNLERTGGGVHVTAFPPHLEVVVDGHSRGQVMSEEEVFVPLKSGIHNLIFRAPGFEDLTAGEIHIDEETPVRLSVRLNPIGGNLFVRRLGGLPLDHLRVTNTAGQVVWEAVPAHDEILIRKLPAGDHLLSLEATLPEGPVLSHAVSLQIREAEITTISLESLPGWAQLRPSLEVVLEDPNPINNLVNKAVKIKTAGIGMLTYARVSTCPSSSAAAQGGVRVGDVLLTLNGHDLGRDVNDQSAPARKSATERLRDLLNTLKIGDSVLLEIERNGERLALKVKLGMRLETK